MTSTPPMRAIGVNDWQFGAIFIIGLAIGLVTPPVGMCSSYHLYSGTVQLASNPDELPAISDYPGCRNTRLQV